MPQSPLSRAAPWEPALLSEKPAGVAAYWAARGKSGGEIADRLARRFPALTAPQIGVLVNQAERVHGIIDDFERGPVYGKIPRVNIPRNPDLLTAYRFIVSGVYLCGKAIVRRTAVLDLAGNPSFAELMGRMADYGALLDVRGGQSDLPSGEACKLIDIHTEQVERRT